MSFHSSLKTTIAAALALALSPLAAGCATGGLIYENVGHPPLSVGGSAESPSIGWDRNLNASMGGRALTKKGVACSQDILKLIAWGDGTQAAAAQQGGVTQVVGVDFHNKAILGFVYTKSCTVVYGNDAPTGAPAEAVAPVAAAPAMPPPPATMAPPPTPAQPPPTPMQPGTTQPPAAPAQPPAAPAQPPVAPTQPPVAPTQPPAALVQPPVAPASAESRLASP